MSKFYDGSTFNFPQGEPKTTPQPGLKVEGSETTLVVVGTGVTLDDTQVSIVRTVSFGGGSGRKTKGDVTESSFVFPLLSLIIYKSRRTNDRNVVTECNGFINVR